MQLYLSIWLHSQSVIYVVIEKFLSVVLVRAYEDRVKSVRAEGLFSRFV